MSSAKELLRVGDYFKSLIACTIIADSPPELPERYTEVIADAQRLVDEQDQQQKEAQEQPQNQPPRIDIYAIDGDTIKIGQRRYRLACIDAPESDQPFGKEATGVFEI